MLTGRVIYCNNNQLDTKAPFISAHDTISFQTTKWSEVDGWMLAQNLITQKLKMATTHFMHRALPAGHELRNPCTICIRATETTSGHYPEHRDQNQFSKKTFPKLYPSRIEPGTCSSSAHSANRWPTDVV